MNNYVHLIIETNKIAGLSKLMKRFNLFYYNLMPMAEKMVYRQHDV